MSLLESIVKNDMFYSIHLFDSYDPTLLVYTLAILLRQTQKLKAHRRSPQNGPSSDWSAQSLLPSQIWWGCRQVDVSLAQGCVGGLHIDEAHDSSSERSSQSLSPSQTQLLLMHFPGGENQKYIKLPNLIGYFQVNIDIPKRNKRMWRKKMQ